MTKLFGGPLATEMVDHPDACENRQKHAQQYEADNRGRKHRFVPSGSEMVRCNDRLALACVA
jgi:hypothetical protein